MNKHVVLGIVAALVSAGNGAAAQEPSVDPHGDWHGTLAAGPVQVRLALHLGDSSTFDSVDQGALGLPAKLSVDGRRVKVTIPGVGDFEGELSTDGQTLSGALVQGLQRTPLRFDRGAWARALRPQTPKPPYPYRSEEAGYDNPKRPGVHLAGTLTLPTGQGRFPAVLLVTGSGAQDRDETMFEHKPFLVLADALTRLGIAVLRVDDRGMGGSTGASPGDTTADFATDVESGVAWLKSRSDIDATRIGLLGHSEGGVIAPMVASRDSSIAFVVLWAGFGVPGADIIVEQVRALSAAAGMPAAAVDAAAALQRKVVTAVTTSPDATAARTAVAKVLLDAGTPAPSEADLAQLTSPWYRYFLSYDPVPALRGLKIPVLAVIGDKDTQVTAAQNAPALRAALAGNPEGSVVVLPSLNHLLQIAQTGSVDEYGKIEETIAPSALRVITEWIAKVVTR
jgi:hypothetical protein